MEYEKFINLDYVPPPWNAGRVVLIKNSDNIVSPKKIKLV